MTGRDHKGLRRRDGVCVTIVVQSRATLKYATTRLPADTIDIGSDVSLEERPVALWHPWQNDDRT